VIVLFADDRARLLAAGRRVRGLPPEIQERAARKLTILDAAESIDDLRAPPGNHLERLAGDRAGQYSIRINAQWRICFVWRERDAHEVEIVDYHQ